MPSSLLQQQRLRVCEICSSYLGLHDNDRRLADHFGGKLHLGFIDLRNRLIELEKFCEENKEAFEKKQALAQPPPAQPSARSVQKSRSRSR